MRRGNDALQVGGYEFGKMSQLQNIKCDTLCHEWYDFLNGGYKLHVNNTIVTKPSINWSGDVPVNSVRVDDDIRVSYEDLKLWYEGNSVSSADGTTNYDAPRLHSSKIYDLRNENCHK